MSTSNKTKIISNFISINGVSERLGISKPLAYRLIREGRLKAHVFGKKALRVHIDDLNKYIKSSAQ